MTRNHVRRQVALSAAALHVATDQPRDFEAEMAAIWDSGFTDTGFDKREYFARYSAASPQED